MSEVLAAIGLDDGIARFLMVLLRVSGIVAFCPIFSSRLLPARLRVALAVVLSVILLPVAPRIAVLDLGVAGWTLLTVRELSVGFGLGLAARVVFDGIEASARLIAGQSGFSLSSMVDPLTGAQSVTPALFQGLLATSLVLAANLHHLFIRGLFRSYEIVPPGPFAPNVDSFVGWVSTLGGRFFAVAIEIAAPGLLVTFAVDLVLILVGRAMPQIPVLIVGYPLKVTGGIVAMGLLALATGSALRWVGETFSRDGAALLSAFGAR